MKNKRQDMQIENYLAAFNFSLFMFVSFGPSVPFSWLVANSHNICNVP